MLKRSLSCLLMILFLMTGMTTGVFAATVTLATGAEVSVTATRETVFYTYENIKAEDVKENADDTDYGLYITGTGDGTTRYPGGVADTSNAYLRSYTKDVSWAYTVNIEQAGLYRLDVLATGGWVGTGAPTADAGGRLILAFDGPSTVEIDTSTVVFPSWGGGVSVADTTERATLGTAEFAAGTYTMTLTATKANMSFKEMVFTPVIPGAVTVATGKPVTVAADGETVFYTYENIKAAEVKANADVTDYDLYVQNSGSSSTRYPGEVVETANTHLRVEKAGASWTHTVNIEQAGWYRLDVLATGGWVGAGVGAPAADAGGRLTVAFDGPAAVDIDTGTVVFPSWGDGVSIPHITDRTMLGTAEFAAGTYTMTLTATKAHMTFKEMVFTPVEAVTGLTGDPVSISGTAETAFYAAENVNTDNAANLQFSDIIEGTDATESSEQDNVVIGAKVNGASWSYTLDVAETGLYQVAVLGQSGYSGSADDTDGGGRFDLSFDYNGFPDGVSTGSVILPPWGDGLSTDSGVPAQHQFTDEDRVILGTVGLSRGTHTMTMKATAAAGGYMRFKKFYFIPVAEEELPYIKIDARAYDEAYLLADAADTTGVINNTAYYTSGIAAVRGPSTWSKADDDGNSYYLEYNFTVETAGEYWVGVRSGIIRGYGANGIGEAAFDNPTIKVTMYDSAGSELGTSSYKSTCYPQAGDGTGLLPRNNAGIYELAAGSYKIRIHNASQSTYFQQIELLPLEDIHKVNGLGKNSFSALELSSQEGIYTIEGYNGAAEGAQYVKLPTAAVGDSPADYDRKAYWDIYVAEGDEGWYDLWFNAAAPDDTTEKYWSVSLDNVESEWFYGQAAVATPGSILPETDRASVYLTAGLHTIGIVRGGSDLHIQTVNLQVQENLKAHAVSDTGITRIMAFDYSDKSHRQPIVRRNVNQLTGAVGMECMGVNAAKQYLTFTVDIPEGQGGWYTPSVRACAWDYTTTTTTTTWKVVVDDATNFVEITCAPDNSYTPDTDADGNPLAKRYTAEGNIYLPAGRHTVTVYTQNGNGSMTYLHCLELEKAAVTETPIEVSASTLDATGSLAIDALDYDGIFGGMETIDWRADGTATALHYYGGPTWFYNRGAVWQLQVAEDAAGTYNLGIKAVQPDPSGTGQVLLVTVDGVDAGYAVPEALPTGTICASGSVSYDVIEPTTQWARPVTLTAGTHEIIVSGRNHDPMYMEGLVLQKAENTYSAVPQSVVYERDATAEAGFADGRVVVTPPTDTTDIAAYHFYWGDENGRLADYTAFGFQPVTNPAAAVSYRIKPGLMIPEGATRILAYPVKAVAGEGVSSLVESAVYGETALPAEVTQALDRDEKLFSFWVNSDTHYEQSGPAETDNIIAINDMLTVDNQTLGIFTTGDITNNGFMSDWLSIKEVYDATLGRQDIPLYIISGNHDTGAQADYPSAASYYLKYASYLSDGRSENNGNAYYYFKENGAYFVFLADEGHGANYGMTSTQLDWLEGVLKQADADKAPVFLFNHYSLSYVDVGLKSLETYAELNTRFQELITSRKNIVYFYGHQHFAQAYYYGTTIGGSDGPNIFSSNTTANGYGPQSSIKVDQNGTEYSNVFTNYIEGHLVDVYNGYVVVRGRSHSTHQWEGFDTFLIKTNYSAMEVSCEDDILTLTKNPNYTEDFTAVVAVYDGEVLKDIVNVSSGELAAVTAKEITLPVLENRRVKVFTWNGMDTLQPLRTVLTY